MQINKFKTLYTNTDPNDIELEYLATARNLRLRNKVTETKFFDSETIDIPSGIIKVLAYELIEFDNDKLQSIVTSGKITPTYSYYIENKYLLIGNTATETKFYLDGILIANPLTNKKFDSAVIYKDQGNILILCDTETLWLGKINRNVWINGTIKNINQWYLDRYLEPYSKDNNGTSLGLKPNRRLGFNIGVGIITDQSAAIEEVAIEFTSLGPKFNKNEGNSFIPGDVNKSKFLWFYIFRSRESISKDFIFSLDSSASEYHIFFEPGDHLGSMLIPKGYFMDDQGNPQNFSFVDKRTISYPIENIQPNLASVLGIDPGDYYLVPKDDILGKDKLIYKSETVKKFGFESSLKDYELVITSILDYKEELITEYIKGNVGVPSAGRYALEINTTIPSNVNSRLTGISYYLRFVDTNDFVQIKSFNLVSANKENANYMKFTIGDISENKIELVQTIGTLFNPNNFELIHAFNQFQRIDDLPYMVSKNQIYGGVTGSGKVLDLFYLDNRIPNVTNKPIVYISNLNGIPAIHDTQKTTLLLASDSGIGKIYYSKRDIIGFAIKNQYDIAVSPDGIAVHTKQGIFIYNGSQLTPISREIDDIVELNHSTGMIFFNNVSKDLYYIINGEFDEFYRYSFVDGTWTSHSVSYKGSSIDITSLERVATDNNGNLLMVTNSKNEPKIYKLTYKLTGEGTLITQLSDLGRSNEYKSFMQYRIDFEGTIKFNDKSYTNTIRKNIIISVPLHLRFSNIKVSIAIILIDNAKIYGIELIEETVAMVDY